MKNKKILAGVFAMVLCSSVLTVAPMNVSADTLEDAFSSIADSILSSDTEATAEEIFANMYKHIEISDVTFYYEIVDEEVTIVSCVTEKSKVTVPEMIEDKPVTTIGKCSYLSDGSVAFDSFVFNDYIQNVILPKTVKKIESPALFDRWHGKSISINANNPYLKMDGGFIVTADGSELVCNLNNIEGNIRLPKGIKIIDSYAFVGQDLTISQIKIPETVEVIKDYAFTDLTYLDLTRYSESKDDTIANIVIPETVKEIGTHAFGYTFKKDYHLLDCALKKINERQNSVFSFVTFSEGMRYVLDNWGAEDNVSKEGFITVGDATFKANVGNRYSKEVGVFLQGCATDSTKLTLPKTLGDYVVDTINMDMAIDKVVDFTECPNVETVVIPYELYVHNSLWNDMVVMPNLKNLQFTNTSSARTTPNVLRNVVYYSENDSNDWKAVFTMPSVDNVILDARVDTIRDTCFRNHQKLKDVTLYEGIVRVEEKAFYGCDNLKSITVKGNINEFERYLNAYYFNNTAIITVYFPDITFESDEDKQIAEQRFYERVSSDYFKVVYGKSGTVTPENSDILLGDANCDGEIDIRDVSAISQSIVKLITLSDKAKQNADIIKDGVIDIKDLSMVKKYLIKDIDSLE